MPVHGRHKTPSFAPGVPGSLGLNSWGQTSGKDLRPRSGKPFPGFALTALACLHQHLPEQLQQDALLLTRVTHKPEVMGRRGNAGHLKMIQGHEGG